MNSGGKSETETTLGTWATGFVDRHGMRTPLQRGIYPRLPCRNLEKARQRQFFDIQPTTDEPGWLPKISTHAVVTEAMNGFADFPRHKSSAALPR